MARYKVTLWGKTIIFILAGLLFFSVVYLLHPPVPVMRGYKNTNLTDKAFDIYFMPDDAEILERQYPVLDKAVADTKGNATMFLYVTGNSSIQQKGKYSYKNGDHVLAQERAQAVADYFINKGIPGFQIFIMENGSNNPAKGKSNDRVELYLK